MSIKNPTILLSAFMLLCTVTTAQNSTSPIKSTPTTKSTTNAAVSTKSGDFYVSMTDYAEFQKLQANLAQSVTAQGSEKKCHIEYRNCWIDKEWRCPSPMYPGSTVHCEEVPVRRCGKPETVCN
jgi:hypothetical protein